MKLALCLLLALPIAAKSPTPGKTRVGLSISSVQIDTLIRKTAKMVKRLKHKK